MTEELPDEIIELIMHFMGAYTHNKEERPYIDDIKLIKDITEYGVKRSILHIKEMRALQKAYNVRKPFWSSGGGIFWGDTFHLQ